MIALLALSALAAEVRLPHQGRLLDAAGAPISGTYDLTFTLYDDAALGGSGHVRHTEILSDVQVADGTYAVVLGSAATLDSSVFSESALWLGVAVEGGAELPRVRLDHVPYAAHAAGVTLGANTAACGSAAAPPGTLRFDGELLDLCVGTQWRRVTVAGDDDGSSQDSPGTSCATIHSKYPGLPSGPYWIDPEGGDTTDAFRVWCEMTLADGGWTLVMKLRQDNVFQWNSAHWTTATVLNEGDLDYTTDTNAKYASFNRVVGTQLLYTRPGVGSYMRYDFGTAASAVTRFASGHTHVSTAGGWRPPESHNNTSNTQCNTFTSQGRGVNYSQACDNQAGWSRARLGEGYEQTGVAHCIWGLGTFNNPCSSPTSGYGAPGGNMRLFVR